MNKKFHGIVVPAVTPLNSDHTLDRKAVERGGSVKQYGVALQ